MHDYIIGALILIIVVAQILVALTTSKKIALFKTILPNANEFETVKVFIPKDQIKTITVEEILNNINRFSSASPYVEIEIPLEIVEEKEVNILNILEDINDDELSIDDEHDYDLFGKTIHSDEIEERTIWMVKDFSERKIKKSQINQYLDMGWSILKDDKYGS
jgi:hypothetical protein